MVNAELQDGETSFSVSGSFAGSMTGKRQIHFCSALFAVKASSFADSLLRFSNHRRLC
jgi:hypothetical protein